MKQKQRERLVAHDGEIAFFAASNSANGFHSYYGEWFNSSELDGVWIIKGGPGTGKSRLMREVAERGLSEGWQAEWIYCSSDPDSLDGVILRRDDNAFALLDGTAPHTREPKLAGVREHLINLGDFWSEERLGAHREEITLLTEEKTEAYRRAYRYLTAYGSCAENRASLVAPLLATEAIDRFARRLTRGLGQGELFSPRTALIRSVGMKGAVWFGSFFAVARQRYLIDDGHGAGEALLEAIYRCAARQRLRVMVSKDPVLPNCLDGLYFPEAGVLFALRPAEPCPYPHRVITVNRFLRRRGSDPARHGILFAERMCRAMLEGALSELETVRLLHFRLEEIYSAAMDFSAKEDFTKRLCERLFHLQNP